MASLHLPLEKVWDHDEVPTAATDGKKIYINSKYFMSLTPPQRETIMAHEGLHPVLGHCSYHYKPKLKMQFPDAKLANMAQDYAINLILKDNGYTPIPDWLCEEKYRGMSWSKYTRCCNKTTLQIIAIQMANPANQANSTWMLCQPLIKMPASLMNKK